MMMLRCCKANRRDVGVLLLPLAGFPKELMHALGGLGQDFRRIEAR